MTTLERTITETIRDLTHRIEILEARIGRMQAEKETASYLTELTRDGYVRGAGLLGWEAFEVDRRAVLESRCEECGHLGMQYEPWHVPGKLRSYRVFAVCGHCGNRTEF